MKKLFGVYRTESEAQKAVDKLRTLGYQPEEISVFSKDRKVSANIEGAESIEADNLKTGAATGIATGTAIGTVGGALAAAGALFIPGIGPILAAGPIATVLAGALAGGAVGGAVGTLAGALANLGVDEEDARYIDERFNEGDIVVHVDSEDTGDKYDRTNALLGETLRRDMVNERINEAQVTDAEIRSYHENNHDVTDPVNNAKLEAERFVAKNDMADRDLTRERNVDMRYDSEVEKNTYDPNLTNSSVNRDEFVESKDLRDRDEKKNELLGQTLREEMVNERVNEAQYVNHDRNIKRENNHDVVDPVNNAKLEAERFVAKNDMADRDLTQERNLGMRYNSEVEKNTYDPSITNTNQMEERDLNPVREVHHESVRDKVAETPVVEERPLNAQRNDTVNNDRVYQRVGMPTDTKNAIDEAKEHTFIDNDGKGFTKELNSNDTCGCSVDNETLKEKHDALVNESREVVIDDAKKYNK